MIDRQGNQGPCSKLVSRAATRDTNMPMRVAPILCVMTIASASSAAPQKWDYADFWTIAGVTFTDSPETVIKKWGAADEDHVVAGERTLRFKTAGNVSFRTDHAIQIDYVAYSKADRDALATHADPKFELLGMTCDQAASRLAFAKKVTMYTTCKHYDANGWMLDVTLTCNKTVNGMTIVWYPLGKHVDPKQLPTSHCD